MEIAVVGGTGTLGRPVVLELVARGHAVRVLTRSAPAVLPPGAEHRAIDLETGAGLGDALDGVDAVVDAANRAGSGRTAAPVIVAGTRRLLTAAAHAGVGHHVAVSIVGIDAVPLSYYRAKLAQEDAVERSAVPWSIVRATQFHELLHWGFGLTARAGFVPGLRFPVAPLDPCFLAGVLADAVVRGPGGRLAPVAGPQVAPLGELARTWARVRGRRAVPLPLPLPRGARRALAAGALVPGHGAVTGGPSFGDWLRAAGEPGPPARARAAEVVG
ncbi:MAG: SDR family oxidoreductase [Solirubrobacteraceae bacterium]